MGRFQDKQKEAKALWGESKKAAEELGSGFANEIQDGKYLCTIYGAELGNAQTSGRFQVTWKFRILDGDEKDTEMWSFQGLDTVKGQAYFRRDLEKLGFDCPEDFEEVPGILNKIVRAKLVLHVQVKTNGEFQNKYINKLVSPDDYVDLGVDMDDEDSRKGKDVGRTVQKEEKDEDPEEFSVEVGDFIMADIDGEEVKVEVLRVKSDGTFLVRNEDGEKIILEQESIQSKVNEEEGEGESAEKEEVPEEETVPEEPAEEEESQTKSGRNAVSRNRPVPSSRVVKKQPPTSKKSKKH